jgi:hypothetical protein
LADRWPQGRGLARKLISHHHAARLTMWDFGQEFSDGRYWPVASVATADQTKLNLMEINIFSRAAK